MKKIFGVGIPGKIRKAGIVYEDIHSGKSYKQNKFPNGNIWTPIDVDVSDDDAGGTPLQSLKIYTKKYTTNTYSISNAHTTPIALETISTENGQPGLFQFISCHSIFRLNGDSDSVLPGGGYVLISDGGVDPIFKQIDANVFFEVYPNLTYPWQTNDMANQVTFFTSPGLGTPGPRTSIDLELNCELENTLAGFGFASIEIYISYTIIQ